MKTYCLRDSVKIFKVSMWIVFVTYTIFATAVCFKYMKANNPPLWLSYVEYASSLVVTEGTHQLLDDMMIYNYCMDTELFADDNENNGGNKYAKYDYTAPNNATYNF